MTRYYCVLKTSTAMIRYCGTSARWADGLTQADCDDGARKRQNEFNSRRA